VAPKAVEDAEKRLSGTRDPGAWAL
jgi:hypothetical protein